MSVGLVGSFIFGSWRVRRFVAIVSAFVLVASLMVFSGGPASGDAGEGVNDVWQARQERVTLGWQASCVVAADDTLHCWGDTVQTDSDVPEPILLSDGGPQLGDVVAISADNFNTCAVVGSGELRCWGANNKGQLGHGTAPTDSIYPVAVLDEGGTGALAGVDQVALGFGHACAVLTDTGVRCWGDNWQGQLGNLAKFGESFPTEPVDLPVPVVLDESGRQLTGVTDISAANNHTCGLMVDGSVRCWGNNGVGQLGTGDTGDATYVAVEVVLPAGVSAVALSGSSGSGRHTCAVTNGSEVFCWGLNDRGQLGNGTIGGFGGEPTPQRVIYDDGTPLSGVVAVSAGAQHSCALLESGQVRCWGRSFFGSLGTGDNAEDKPNPQTVVMPDGSGAPLVGVGAMSVGGSHSCAILDDWTMVCWGWDSVGQLGNGSDVNDLVTASSLPVLVHLTDPLNRPPTADPLAVTALVGTTETITLSGSDPDGETLSFTISTSPSGGILSAVSAASCVASVCTATVDYTPDTGTVSDSFEFTVNDGFATSDSATVSVTLVGNLPPTANDDLVSTAEDTAVTVDVAANDTDSDLDPTSATVVGAGPGDGTLVNNGDGSFAYTPDAHFNGTDTFNYEICDTAVQCDTATVTITVTPVPDPPDAVDDTASVDEDGTVDINVLGNDLDHDDDPLTVISVSDPADGAATINPDQTVTYTPDPDFCGADTVSYTIDDGTDRTDTATVTVTVVCVDDPTTVDAGGPTSGDEGDSITIDGSVIDPDSALTVTWSYAPGPEVDPGAACTIDDTALLATTLSCDDDGTYTLTLTADDGTNPPVSDTADVTIHNLAPAVEPGPDQSVSPDEPVTITVSFGDPGDNDSHTATIDWDDGAGSQTATIDPVLKTVTATLPGGYPNGATATVIVEVCDDDEACSTGTLTVTVDICDIRGTDAGETLMGTSGPDVICGLGGDDIIYGLGGDDVIYGGDGNDRVIGGPGNDIMFGGENSFANLDDGWRDPATGDRVSYADATNGVTVDLRLTGPQPTGWGTDTIVGFENIFGSQHADLLKGNGLRNVIWAWSGADQIYGFGGRDRIFGATEDEARTDSDDMIWGGADGDWILAGLGKDTVYGEAGDDDISGNKGNDVLWGGIGNDIVRGNDGKDSIHGGPGDDSLFGFAGNDTLWGDGGADLVVGGAGRDKAYGGAGSDDVQGGAGNRDKVYGTGPNQTDGSSDKLNGGAGTGDKCIGSKSLDTWTQCNLKVEPA